MTDPSFLLRAAPSGPVVDGTPGNVLTIQADGRHVAGEPPGTGAVLSVFGRIGAVLAQFADYSTSLIANLSIVPGFTDTDALNSLQAQISSIIAGGCVPNQPVALGQYSCAENNQNTANGFASHAEGTNNRAGLIAQAFTIPAGGTLVTIAGDVTPFFEATYRCRIAPTTPAVGPTVYGTINTTPVFAAGNTTFSLAAPIDVTTTGGSIVESNPTVTTGGIGRGNGAHAEGVLTVAQGANSHAEGASTIAYGPGAHAEGGFAQAFGVQAHAENESTIAMGTDSHAEGGSTFAGGFCAHVEGGAGATQGPSANGNSSHAEGLTGRTGNVQRTFTCAANGTLITIAGNVVSEFPKNTQTFFLPQTPIPGCTLSATTANADPVFDGVNTTFNITVPFAAQPGLQAPQEPATALATTGGLCLCGTAAGQGAHAEGGSVIATGQAAHAEGNQTIASGNLSHAEGFQSVASGAEAHAEGQTTIARATNSHTEGVATSAQGNGSHAEGASTRTGNLGRAFTIAAGGVLVTIAGNVTTEFVNGNPANIDPTPPVAPLQVNVPRQVRNVASVPAFAAGNTTFNLASAIDAFTTAGVIWDSSFGQNSHAEGTGSIATALSAHAEGDAGVASGQGSHAEGGASQATAIYAHAEGLFTVASGTHAHAEGNQCTAGPGTNAHAEGNLCTASGANSHAEGNGTTASATSSHAEGDSTLAQGLRSHAEGTSTIANNTSAHAEGTSTLASGFNAHAEGATSNAVGDYSHAGGVDSKTLASGEFSRANGKFAAIGDNQTRSVQIRGSTPGSGLGETAALGGGTAIGVNTLESSKAYQVTVRAIATVMGLGAAARQTASFYFTFIASVRSGGTVDISAVGVVAAPIVQGAGLVGATLVPSTTGANNLTLTFAIAAGLTTAARCTAFVEYVEVLGT